MWQTDFGSSHCRYKNEDWTQNPWNKFRPWLSVLAIHSHFYAKCSASKTWTGWAEQLSEWCNDLRKWTIGVFAANEMDLWEKAVKWHQMNKIRWKCVRKLANFHGCCGPKSTVNARLGQWRHKWSPWTSGASTQFSHWLEVESTRAHLENAQKQCSSKKTNT